MESPTNCSGDGSPCQGFNSSHLFGQEFYPKESNLFDQNYWALLLLLVCIGVVVGNVLVILAVVRERTLQNITNYFIVSLAVADLLVAGVVMPFYTYTLLNWGKWYLPQMACDFYIAMDVICSTSSIFNLVAISVDRFFAVTSPIFYSQQRHNTTRAYLVIGVCWVVSASIGIPIMLGLNHIPIEEKNINSTQVNDSNGSSEALKNDDIEEEAFVCAFYNPDFIIYSSLGSFWVPCIIMSFLYVRIFKTLHARAKLQSAPRKGLASAVATSSMQVTKQLAVTDDEDNLQPQAETSFNGKQCSDSSTPINTDKPDCDDCSGKSAGLVVNIKPEQRICSKCSQVIKNGNMVLKPINGKVDKNVSTRDDSGIQKEKQDKIKEHLPRYRLQKRSKKIRKKKRDKSSAKKEKKATKTLAIVLACFLICWVPFFTCNILDALSIKFGIPTSPGSMAFHITTLLGYVNSCINPLIYTIFNPEFRKAFKRVLGMGH